jgi:hypothetical protein
MRILAKVSKVIASGKPLFNLKEEEGIEQNSQVISLIKQILNKGVDSGLLNYILH